MVFHRITGLAVDIADPIQAVLLVIEAIIFDLPSPPSHYDHLFPVP